MKIIFHKNKTYHGKLAHLLSFSLILVSSLLVDGRISVSIGSSALLFPAIFEFTFVRGKMWEMFEIWRSIIKKRYSR